MPGAEDLIIQPDAIAVIVRHHDGSYSVHTNHHPVGAGATWGMFWGFLFGLLFFIPVFGLAIGAGLGALMGKMAKTSIDKQFQEQVRDMVQPGTSALFLMLEKVTPDKGRRGDEQVRRHGPEDLPVQRRRERTPGRPARPAGQHRNPDEPRSQPAPASRAHPGSGPTPAGPMTAVRPAPARDRWRFVPMVGWIRSYERAWLRGDLIAGVTVAALIVPKNLGYAGIAGIPLQNGLQLLPLQVRSFMRSSGRADISTGPSSGLAAVAASAVAVAGITGLHNVASFVAMITLVSGVLVPSPRGAEDGLDRAVPVPGRGDRLPVRRGDRRGDR